MNMHPASQGGAGRLRRGSLILESSVALAFASTLALLLLKGSIIGLSGNQWSVMQTLTDAYLTRETALANRTPLADILAPNSPWPDPETDVPERSEMTVTIGKLIGGTPVQGRLVRFRINETTESDAITQTNTYRLCSVLSYRIGGKDYHKTRSTLRNQ
jgi:hypothetical protein